MGWNCCTCEWRSSEEGWYSQWFQQQEQNGCRRGLEQDFHKQFLPTVQNECDEGGLKHRNSCFFQAQSWDSGGLTWCARRVNANIPEKANLQIPFRLYILQQTAIIRTRIYSHRHDRNQKDKQIFHWVAFAQLKNHKGHHIQNRENAPHPKRKAKQNIEGNGGGNNCLHVASDNANLGANPEQSRCVWTVMLPWRSHVWVQSYGADVLSKVLTGRVEQGAFQWRLQSAVTWPAEWDQPRESRRAPRWVGTWCSSPPVSRKQIGKKIYHVKENVQTCKSASRLPGSKYAMAMRQPGPVKE